MQADCFCNLLKLLQLVTIVIFLGYVEVLYKSGNMALLPSLLHNLSQYCRNPISILTPR